MGIWKLVIILFALDSEMKVVFYNKKETEAMSYEQCKQTQEAARNDVNTYMQDFDDGVFLAGSKVFCESNEEESDWND